MGVFTPSAIANAVALERYSQRKQVKNMLRDFVKRGEIERIATGLYKYRGLTVKRTKLEVVWHLVRSHRTFTAAEIERLSGAARPTVLEYLNCLKGFGYLRKIDKYHWRLVKDPGPDAPVNTAKCKRLKEIRKTAGVTRTQGGLS